MRQHVVLVPVRCLTTLYKYRCYLVSDETKRIIMWGTRSARANIPAFAWREWGKLW